MWPTAVRNGAGFRTNGLENGLQSTATNVSTKRAFHSSRGAMQVRPAHVSLHQSAGKDVESDVEASTTSSDIALGSSEITNRAELSPNLVNGVGPWATLTLTSTAALAGHARSTERPPPRHLPAVFGFRRMRSRERSAVVSAARTIATITRSSPVFGRRVCRGVPTGCEVRRLSGCESSQSRTASPLGVSCFTDSVNFQKVWPPAVGLQARQLARLAAAPSTAIAVGTSSQHRPVRAN